MATTAARRTRTATRKPLARSEVRLTRKPICCCEMCPQGRPGLLEIRGTAYEVAYNAELPQEGEPHIYGFKLTNLSSGATYDIDCADGVTCDCPDQSYRSNELEHGCKHGQAIRIIWGAGLLR